MLLISKVKPEDCECSGRLLLVHITQERCDLKEGKSLSKTQYQHLGDEAGIRKANEEGSEDNEGRVRVDKGLHPGLAHVGRVGYGEEGEEVGDESQQEAQEHYWVSSFPMKTP